MKQWVIYSA